MDIKKVVRHLKCGGVIVYPTETSYGLGADATNEEAVKKIFVLKGRERGKPLPLIVGNLRDAERIARFSPRARALAKQYWPGPLTLVLPVKTRANLAMGVRFHGTVHGTVAVRVSAHPVARAIAARLGRPLVSTSANLSGKEPCYSIMECKRYFGHQKDIFFVDGGRLKKQPPSTIVMVRGKKIQILRQGAVTLTSNKNPLHSRERKSLLL